MVKCGSGWAQLSAIRLYRIVPFRKFDLGTRTINDRWRAGTIVSTISLDSLDEVLQACRHDIQSAVRNLQNASIDVDYHPETLASPAHWIYEPDESITYHRLLLRSNFVPGAVGTGLRRIQSIQGNESSAIPQ